MDTSNFDYIIIGSGFGGSVSAMRLSQKGYKVAIIESGKKWEKKDFAKSNWNIRKSLWIPKIFLHGIQRLHLLNDIFVFSGAGVGGGSLNYGNTLYIPPDKFFENETVKRLGGKKSLAAYYELAEKMLGVTENQNIGKADRLMRETVAEFGREKTFHKARVGVYFGEEGKKSKDPYFLGEGPDRIGCKLCRACLCGCRKGGKNTLNENYLYFAKKFGVTIIPENKVINVQALSDDGSEGYEIRSIRTTGLFPRKNTYRTKGIVFSAGVLGTLSLLMKMKDKGNLPHLSEDLGKVVRTNSEALMAVKSNTKNVDFSKGIAITSSVHPDANTHIEPVRYAKGNDLISLLLVLGTDGGNKITRPFRYIANILMHPIRFFHILNPIGFAYKSIILLLMQNHDNYFRISLKRRLIWPFIKTLTSKQPKEKKTPSYIPILNSFGRRLAKRMNGTPCNAASEVFMGAPITAHIMGGCGLGTTPEKGVIDEQNRVKGYKNMLVVDASVIPANLGVNPALTIVALSERAMSFIPVKASAKIKSLKVEKHWGVSDLLVPVNKK